MLGAGSRGDLWLKTVIVPCLRWTVEYESSVFLSWGKGMGCAQFRACWVWMWQSEAAQFPSRLALEALQSLFPSCSLSEVGPLIMRWRAANELAEDLGDSSDGTKGLP